MTERITAIICTRGQRQRCQWCSGVSSKLCDYPVVLYKTLAGEGKPGTCDARMCSRHATAAGPGKDFCPPHARLSQRDQEEHP